MRTHRYPDEGAGVDARGGASSFFTEADMNSSILSRGSFSLMGTDSAWRMVARQVRDPAVELVREEVDADGEGVGAVELEKRGSLPAFVGGGTLARRFYDADRQVIVDDLPDGDDAEGYLVGDLRDRERGIVPE